MKYLKALLVLVITVVTFGSAMAQTHPDQHHWRHHRKHHHHHVRHQ
jgi:hypothetical protein